MKLSLSLVGMLALLAASVNAQQQNAPDDSHQVQGGLRIGRVFIGDTRAAVARRLGKPTKTFALGRNLMSQIWHSRKPDDETGNRNTLEVVYRSGIVSQIEATSLGFKTPSSLSLTSSRAQWEKVYGKPTVSTYKYAEYGLKRYLDWKSKGITIEMIRSEDETRERDSWLYQTLIIHKKGVPVIPDKGGTRE